MQNFKGKVAVITGAASGIGKGLATRCVQEGMKVVLADIEEAALNEVSSELQAAGADVLAVVTDVAKAESVQQLANTTVERFGAVHLLFNNAGVVAVSWSWKSTLADWDWVSGVNLWGVIHGIRAFVPIMLEQKVECHIVNTASITGLTAIPGLSIYAATKHAVIALSETLYLELEQIKSQIHVAVLCPISVQTHIGESARNRPASKSDTATARGEGLYDTEIGQKFWQRVQQQALSPEQIANIVFAAMREKRFYILSESASVSLIEQRMKAMLDGRNPSNAMSTFCEIG